MKDPLPRHIEKIKENKKAQQRKELLKEMFAVIGITTLIYSFLLLIYHILTIVEVF